MAKSMHACVRGIMLIYVHKCASVQRICAFSDEGENWLSKLYMLEYVLRVLDINIISIPNFNIMVIINTLTTETAGNTRWYLGEWSHNLLTNHYATVPPNNNPKIKRDKNTRRSRTIMKTRFNQVEVHRLVAAYLQYNALHVSACMYIINHGCNIV